MRFDGSFDIGITLDGELSTPTTINGELGVYQKVWAEETYDGATVVTPSQEQQVLPTAGKTVTENIVVNPIPQNYGLITWDGSVLRVS